jgi:hypothetical protein
MARVKEMDWIARRCGYKACRQVPSALIQEIGDRKGLEHGKGKGQRAKGEWVLWQGRP